MWVFVHKNKFIFLLYVQLNLPVRQSAPGSWINLQGKKLVRAEEQLEEQVRLVDREFDVFHGTGLKAGNDIKQKTIDFILGRDSCKEIPSPVVKIFTNIKFHNFKRYLFGRTRAVHTRRLFFWFEFVVFLAFLTCAI